MVPFVVVQLYTDVGDALVILITADPIPQYTSDVGSARTRGARKKSKGPTKSLSSAVKEVEALVFTNTRRKGIPQPFPPNKVTGSNPSLVRFTENSMYWLDEYVVAMLLSTSIREKGPAQVLLTLSVPV